MLKDTISEAAQAVAHQEAEVLVPRFPARKPYASPHLREHGRFERLTLQTSGTGQSQGGDDGPTG